MNYVADFETYVPPKETLDLLDRKNNPTSFINKNDIETYVWAYGITEVGKIADEDIKIGNNIDDFMEHCFSLKNPKIYFHNLKFDGIFILDWAFKNGYIYSEDKVDKSINVIISKLNMFYQIELIQKRRKKGYKKVVFQDSLKKLPFTVDKIGKGFKLDFNKIEVEEDFYLKFRSKTHQLTEEEKEYVRNDIRVISQALQIQFAQGLTKMTNGSDALSEFKNVIGEKQFSKWFPILDDELNEMIRLAYKGGYVIVNEKYQGVEVKDGLVFDVNSLYPYVMYDKKMPYGKPLFYQGKYVNDSLYDLYIQELWCEFKVKKDHLPTIQIKGQYGRYNPREYLKESRGLTKLHLSNVDLKLFLEHYDVWNIEYSCGLKFRSHVNMFKNYIDKWTAVKITNDGAIRELAKLMLNSLYGKFATNTDVTGKYTYLGEDGTVKFALKERESREPIYTAVGVFTTSYGRELTIRTAQENYDRFAYADTDSVHLVGTELPKLEVHDKNLGKWKMEGRFSWAKYIGAKCYAEEFDSRYEENDGIFKGEKGVKLDVKCAGMTSNQKKMVTKENFEVGLELSGKKMPVVVRGGVVLVDKTFKMKVRAF